ncbi:MAG: hypothetical protein FJ146_11140 [Deltaproteobacteria bacterium]|nr:hypothetical protein [Deltaproteobacteria bacterium]
MKLRQIAAAAVASLTLSSAVLADTENAEHAGAKIRKVVVDACLAQFPDHPFGSDQVNPRLLAPTINVINRTSVLLDDTKTDAPELVIIAGTINIFGTAEFKLLNPNAWYCIPANLAIFGTTTIDIHQNAHLAQVNVPVGSTVTVRKVDDEGKPVGPGGEL